jgi:hypothetical protein
MSQGKHLKIADISQYNFLPQNAQKYFISTELSSLRSQPVESLKVVRLE